MARLSTLLGVACLGSGAVLLLGRGLLQRLPAATPASSSTALEISRRWSVDPQRRRDAALLLSSRAEADPARQLRLLRGQGWGRDPLAAVVLKRQALAEEQLGLAALADAHWRELLGRFPDDPASAEALYALGRRQPVLRQRLLRRFPAHPAALAAALEAGPAPRQRLEGLLHLARWGPRWPGAEARLLEACGRRDLPLNARQRALLSEGLAELGQPGAAEGCLQGQPAAAALLSPRSRLNLARPLLHGDSAEQQRGEVRLLALIRQAPSSPEAEEAVRLLAQGETDHTTALLKQLPPSWSGSAPVQAHALLAQGRGQGGAQAEAPATPASVAAALQLLRRWPDDPASWDLQWQLARRQLLAGRTAEARQLLQAIDPRRLPPPLEARQRFWLADADARLGEPEAARSGWRELLRRTPGGYYGWRAARRLGVGDLQLTASERSLAPVLWQPLASGNPQLDRLWRLDQRNEAWEMWRQLRRNRPPRQAREQLVEGRLRQGVGDDWLGFALLEQAGLNLRADRCELAPLLEASSHPPRFLTELEPAARQAGLPLPLLLGIAKQESRFSPGVRSPVGAVGLLQLMPDTAAELAGGPISGSDLEDPGRNAQLGSRYLARLLRQWGHDPLLAVASYNAGPGAVQGWLNPRLRREPELWVEAIPYPETRLYVKKVLGNAWSYQSPRRPGC